MLISFGSEKVKFRGENAEKIMKGKRKEGKKSRREGRREKEGCL